VFFAKHINCSNEAIRILKVDLKLSSGLLESDFSKLLIPEIPKNVILKIYIFKNCRISTFGEVKIKKSKMWKSRFQVVKLKYVFRILTRDGLARVPAELSPPGPVEKLGCLDKLGPITYK